MQEHRKQEVRSEQVTEILGSPPKSIIRWGITVIFLIIIGLFVGSWFFKYPEIITAKVNIVTENPSIPLKSFATGKIIKLFVAENQLIAQDEIIAIIENTTNYDDFLLLKQIVESNSFEDNFQNLKLGELQQSYSDFQRNVRAYNNFKTLDYHNNKIKSTEIQIAEYQSYFAKQNTQLDILKQELQLSEKTFTRDENLYKQKVIAAADYEQSQQTFLQQKRNYETTKLSLDNTKMQITQLRQQILDFQLQKIQEQDNYELQINETLFALKSQILQWEKMYLIKTPISGRVTFTELWSENQNVLAGQTVATVVPEEHRKIIGKLIIPTAGAGKIKTGQTVNIKLDNFPYMEFGMLKAKITKMSLVPIENENGIFYTAEISLLNSFTTTYGKILPFSQNLNGTAEIITDDLNLFQRLVNPVRKLFEN